jgi:hypothetical protein
MIRTISYRDLTPKQRTEGARKARARLKGFLNNPFLTVDQIKAVYDKITLVGRWERLEIEVQGPRPPPAMPTLAAAPQAVAALPAHQPPPPAQKPPQHHKVDVTDLLTTKEKVS